MSSLAFSIRKINKLYSRAILSVFHRYTFGEAFFSSKVIENESSEIPKNELENVHSAMKQPGFGVIYDKKPFKIELDPQKNYSWCACGQSKNQPFCDGTHKSPYLQIKLKPVRFKVAEKKNYWLCNCKQTKNRPFCDGTHKREDIQAKK